MAFIREKHLTDAVTFPAKPGSGTAARQQFEDVLAEFETELIRLGTQESVTAATLLNGWANIDGFEVAGFWKDGIGNVHIRAYVSGGSTSLVPIMTLPAGYRPVTIHEVPTVSYNGTQIIAGRILIYPDGSVKPDNVSNSWLIIDAHFRVDQ